MISDIISDVDLTVTLHVLVENLSILHGDEA